MHISGLAIVMAEDVKGISQLNPPGIVLPVIASILSDTFPFLKWHGISSAQHSITSRLRRSLNIGFFEEFVLRCILYLQTTPYYESVSALLNSIHFSRVIHDPLDICGALKNLPRGHV